MAEKLTEITGSEKKENDKGSYLVLKIRGSKGVYDKPVFSDEIAKQFDGPGMYEVAYKKVSRNGKDYFNVSGLKKRSTTVLTPTTGGVMVTQTLDPNSLNRELAICAQVAVKSASDVTVAIIGSTNADIAFVNKTHVADFTLTLAQSFMSEMRQFVSSGLKTAEKKEEKKNEAHEQESPEPVGV